MLNAQSVTGKAVVIGAGTMGGGIAAQLANAGWLVTLLDVADSEAADPKQRSRVADAGRERLIANKPPLLFVPEFASRIEVGNTTDDLACLSEADWVIEAVSERMELKKAILTLIAANAGRDTLVSSNTSGLSLREMTAQQTPEFRDRFLGTHFLNPPRYLKLLEVIPLPETKPETISDFQQFAEQILGQRVVVAKDTPGFISTRIWITHLLDTIHTALTESLTVEEVDYLTGALLGRPASATFRMADIVGLDIIASIAANQHARLANDPLRERLVLPDKLKNLIETGRIGQKVGEGFYSRDGKTILALDFASRQYRPRREIKIAEVEALARVPLTERLTILLEGGDAPWQRFLGRILNTLCSYVAQIGGEIAGDALTIDRVMEWGFQWQIGPCAIQDCRTTPNNSGQPEQMNYSGTAPNRSYRIFGTSENPRVPQMEPEKQEAEWVQLRDLKASSKAVRSSEAGTLVDLGDGVICLEFHTKMNTFSPGMVTFLDSSRELAEQSYAGLVIGNQAKNFSAGYNLNLFVEAIEAHNWQRLDTLLRDIQFAFMRLKYAKVPVVGAPFGYTLGAGCECSLHCAALQAAPELVMGLPELDVGVIPAGGGTKELLTRAMRAWDGTSDALVPILPVFDLITAARNSGSAEQARQMGLLRERDRISRNADRQLYEAKQFVLSIAGTSYQAPAKDKVWITGPDGLARLRVLLHGRFRAGQISEHDRLIADRIAWILSGGDLPAAQYVTEEYLLRLEREAFVRLAHEEKSVDRMRHVLATGKPLKN